MTQKTLLRRLQGQRWLKVFTMNKVLLFTIFAAFYCPSAATQQYPPRLYQDLGWRMIGPFRGGRTRAVAGVPSQPGVFYIGAVNGGVWRSDDYGRTWTAIFDDQPTQSIGAIAVAPADPNILYVATGEGLQRPDLSIGNGIYKSTDAGKTWTHLGLRDGEQIPALAIDPRDPNRIFAAVLGHPYGSNPERGIFRSTDGGTTWQKILYKDENTGGSDVELDPADPTVVYASLWQSRLGPWEDKNQLQGTNGGLFKSTDGGNTWRQLTKGLPGNLAQINLAIAPSQSHRLYATVATTEPTAYGTDKGLGFYRSDDAGESWYRVTDDPRPAMKIGGGDLAVPKVDPKNPDVVYSASIVTMRSTDGGKVWESLRGAPGGDDYQNLWINPDNPSIILLVSDQGALVTVNGGRSWSSWYNQPTAQLYHAIATNEFPYKVCGGQQESGSVCISSRGNDGAITFRDWRPVGVIEYGYVAPDPLSPDIFFGAGRSEVSRYHWSTGQVENVTPVPIGFAATDRGETAQEQESPKEKGETHPYRADRTEPIVFSPVDPHALFYATNVLFETNDRGESWRQVSPDLTRKEPGVPASVSDQFHLNPGVAKQRGVIYAVAPSFQTTKVIWVGTDDGLIWITRDGGANWTDITPPALTPWSKISQICASRFDEQTAYVAVNRFRIDDVQPHIFRTHDGGKTWQEISRGLPDKSPVNTVREDSVRKGLLFAGTETSVWVSFDFGDHWQSLQLNLPHTSMRDLWIHDDDLIVASHGRSFWILDDIAPLRQLDSEIASSDVHLFAPAPAIRVRRNTNTDTPLPADEPAGENPPDGALIDYYLSKPVPGPLAVEIRDPQGKLVRRYSSDDNPEQTQAELEKQLIPLYWLKPEQVPSLDSGMHRWIWDLRYATPTSTLHEYPISAVPHRTPHYPLGPLVLPGTYTIRLIAGGKIETAQIAVKMDPRIKANLVSLRAQFDLAMRLATDVSRSSQAVSQARSVQEQLTNISKKQGSSSAASAKQLAQRVAAILDGASKESEGSTLKSANQNAIDLYKDVEKSDAAPSAAQLNAYAITAHQLSQAIVDWDSFKEKELAGFNRQLHSSGAPEILLDLPPRQKETGENEE
jgi:photosystem II stability/assembly factor-like uncharacterized protein